MGGQPHDPTASTPGKDPFPTVQEVGLAPGPVWTEAENLAPTGIFFFFSDPRIAQPVASRYTDYATRPTTDEVYCLKYRHTRTRQHDVIYGILFPSPTATVSVNPSRVSLATAIHDAFSARVFVICSVILAYPLHHHLPLCKVKTQTSLANRLKQYVNLFIWAVARP